MNAQVDAWWVIVAGIPGVLALIWLVVLWISVRRLRRDQRVLLPTGERAGIVERQAAAGRSIERLRDDLDAVRADLAGVAERTDESLVTSKRIHHLERYDAYKDDGGRQSWSLAILDAHGDGSIITSLAGREGTRMFVKRVRGGVGEPALSPEEQRAVDQARAGDA